MAEKNRGFDVLGTAYEHDRDVVAQVQQVLKDIQDGPPQDFPGIPDANGRFIIKRQGDRAMVEYHLQEMGLDNNQKCEDMVKASQKAIADLVRDLKKEYRKRTKVALTMKEDKQSAGWHREKVSLNNLWYLRTWRVYDVKPQADQSEEV